MVNIPVLWIKVWLHPWKLRMNLKITQSKISSHLNHPPPWLWVQNVNLPGCNGTFQGVTELSLYFSLCQIQLHSGRLTWNLKITQLKRKIIFKASIIMFHVNFQGCIPKVGLWDSEYVCWGLEVSPSPTSLLAFLNDGWPKKITSNPSFTLPETNIAHENWWLEDYISFWGTILSGANC